MSLTTRSPTGRGSAFAKPTHSSSSLSTELNPSEQFAFSVHRRFDATRLPSGGSCAVYLWQDAEEPAACLVGRFHGSNHMPTKIGPSACSCKMPVNEEAMMAADMIGFMESVV
jgi:hypothetical protein